ncbi:hypothetical protein GCM10009662_28090 [Catellatospora coxensis]|uniref:Uncharacterized protein n=1 Tax=Catellatospora coxensis TaxID=310354 RepID=A0A8J3L6A7_9ACTN|nr:hypothetical protein Cco03nite_53650 [Catellatospora coxensis]
MAEQPGASEGAAGDGLGAADGELCSVHPAASTAQAASTAAERLNKTVMEVSRVRGGGHRDESRHPRTVPARLCPP